MGGMEMKGSVQR
jgi:hypothetical protein